MPTVIEQSAEGIRKRIEAYEEKMIELAMEYIQLDSPFPEATTIKSEWDELNQQVRGLFEALEIVEGFKDFNQDIKFAMNVIEQAVTKVRDEQKGSDKHV